jgi:hypothetical protein
MVVEVSYRCVGKHVGHYESTRGRIQPSAANDQRPSFSLTFKTCLSLYYRQALGSLIYVLFSKSSTRKYPISVFREIFENAKSKALPVSCEREQEAACGPENAKCEFSFSREDVEFPSLKSQLTKKKPECLDVPTPSSFSLK